MVLICTNEGKKLHGRLLLETVFDLNFPTLKNRDSRILFESFLMG